MVPRRVYSSSRASRELCRAEERERVGWGASSVLGSLGLFGLEALRGYSVLS